MFGSKIVLETAFEKDTNMALNWQKMSDAEIKLSILRGIRMQQVERIWKMIQLMKPADTEPSRPGN